MTFVPSYIVIHHSATDLEASVDDIRAVHIARGMDDIGYHFLIDRFGAVIPGRSLAVCGAHALGINQISIGICCIGDYSSTLPSLKVIESLVSLVSKLRVRFNIDASNIIGHRDVTELSPDATPTICPGNALYSFLQRIRERSTPSYQELIDDDDSLNLPSEPTPPTTSEYKAEIEISTIEQKQNFLLLVKGFVKNIGILSWNLPSDDPFYPIRIGLIAFTQNDGKQTILDEMRFELPEHPIAPGVTSSFTFEINKNTLPEGEVSMIVSVVRERDFWFHQKDTTPASETISIKHTTLLRKSAKPIFELPSHTSKIRILYIGPTLALFDRDTGGRRLLSILTSFIEMGYELTVAYETPGVLKDSEKYISALTSIGISVVHGPLNFLSECSPNAFSTCILGWYSCAEKYISIVREVFPLAKIIVDSVDIHWLREARGVALGALTLSQESLAENKQKEISVYSAADEVWVVSEDDRSALLSELPDISTRIISLMTERKPSIFVPNSRKILFVGSFNHPPNISAALWGYEICQSFRKTTSCDFAYYIVGANPPDEIKRLHDGRKTIVTDFVEDLTPLYSTTKIFLAPIRYGAGVKGKITDAACIGLPIITSSIGNEGIGLKHGSEGWVCDDTDSFVSALKIAFDPKTSLNRIANAGRQRVLQITGIDSTLPLIRSSVESRPIVISIVTYNRCDLLRMCLDSLISLTNFPSWSICVVSNGCTDGTVEYLQELQARNRSKITLIRNEHNDFFIRPNNEVICLHPEEDIVLLNNDTEITDPRWLYELQQAAYTSPLIGTSGCLILDSKGQISEAGGKIASDGTGTNIGRGLNKDNPIAQSIRYTGFVSGCCMYMRRDFINQFGTLDEDLHPMYYEDVEWQFRLHSFGFKTLWTPRTEIIHHEGSSAGTNLTVGLKRYQEINRKKFLNKFKGAALDSLNE